MVKNPLSKAGDAGSIPHRGTKIPHAAGQLLSLRDSTRERKPAHHNQREAGEHRNERYRTPQRRSCCNKDPTQSKKNESNKDAGEKCEQNETWKNKGLTHV